MKFTLRGTTKKEIGRKLGAKKEESGEPAIYENVYQFLLA